MQRLLVIFDLDETLVYGADSPLDRPCDFEVGNRYFVYRRPHVGQLLTECFQAFDIAVWSSASADYGSAIVKALGLDSGQLKFVWARERCTWRLDHELGTGHWLKNLKKVKLAGYDLGRVVMVDDSKEKVKLQYGNHIPVRPYLGSSDDDELVFLLQYLRQIGSVDDVRRLEKRNWRLRIGLT